MLNNFYTIGFRANNSIDRIYEIIPMEFKKCFKFQGQTKVMMLISELKCLQVKSNDFTPYISYAWLLQHM
jgi:hypothetical protein